MELVRTLAEKGLCSDNLHMNDVINDVASIKTRNVSFKLFFLSIIVLNNNFGVVFNHGNKIKY